MYIRRNRRENGTEYYDTLLVYVDDILEFIHSPKSIMRDIGLAFDIKDNKYGPPTTYLGDNIELFQMSDEKYSWSIKFNSYVAAAVQTVKDLLSEDNREYKSGNRPHKGPIPHEYNPELDVADEYDAEHRYQFQKLIGIL